MKTHYRNCNICEAMCGLEISVEGGEIRIGGRCGNELLTVWVENPVDEDSSRRPGAGVGLANVRHRLDNVFGDKARLRCGISGNVYRAEVVVPLSRAAFETVAEDTSDG